MLHPLSNCGQEVYIFIFKSFTKEMLKFCYRQNMYSIVSTPVKLP